ncbi:MAG: YHS domain-containing (seleno)protein [Oceanipulchritudo sp.]
MKPRIHLIALIGLILGGVTASAEHRVLMNKNANRLAINGYDPVAFFMEGEPVKGRPGHQAIYKGAVFRFSSASNLEAFLEEPDRYEPEFGGYCPVSLSKDMLASGDPMNFRIMQDRLYLMHDTQARKRLTNDRVSEATRRWEAKVQRHGVPYASAGITR